MSKPLEDLVDDPSDSLDEICQRLDTPTAGLGNYKNIARHYGYKFSTVRARFKTSPDGPSKALILAIIDEHPDVTVELFQFASRKEPYAILAGSGGFFLTLPAPSRTALIR